MKKPLKSIQRQHFTLQTGIWTRQLQDAHQYNKDSSSTCKWNAIVSSRLAVIVVGCTEFVVAGLNSEPMMQYNTVLVEFVHKLPANIYPFNSMHSINANQSAEQLSLCLQAWIHPGRKWCTKNCDFSCHKHR